HLVEHRPPGAQVLTGRVEVVGPAEALILLADRAALGRLAPAGVAGSRGTTSAAGHGDEAQGGYAYDGRSHPTLNGLHSLPPSFRYICRNLMRETPAIRFPPGAPLSRRLLPSAPGVEGVS